MPKVLLKIAVTLVATAIGGALHAIGARHDSLHVAVRGLHLELLAPRWLYLLLLLPYLWLVKGASLADLSRGQQALSLGVRALLLCALVGALARPSLVTDRQVVHTVVLVDTSDSVADRQLEEARTYIESLRAARLAAPTASQITVVTFAARPRVLDLPGDDATPLPPLPRPKSYGEAGDASDLAGALRLAYGLYPPGVIRRAVLLSDGNQTQGDLVAEAHAATSPERRVRLDVRPYAALHDDEVLVRELRVPDGVRLGAPFTVHAEIYASRAVPVTLTLFQDEFVNPLDGRRSVTLAAGRNAFTFRAQVKDAGVVTYKLAISGLPADFKDRFPTNNQASSSLAIKGKPRILYIEGEPSASSYLTHALAKENIDVETRGPYGLPSSPKDLAKYDLVLLSDVPITYVGPDQMGAIEAYVRELGGGFIMAGGENSFGSGGYGGTRMERLLPVRFDTERKRDQPSLALILAIDRSGSMQGEKLELAKDAAKASAELLGPEDLIGVIAFDAQAQPIVRLQRAANRIRILSDISRLTAGGGTSILAPLQEAYQELAPARAKIKHVILLTDGQASYDGINEVVEEMAQSHITVSAVGVGTGADKTLLTMIAERGGGRFYFTQDAANVPKIFTKETTEVAKSTLVEEAIHVHVAKRAELLDGVPIDSSPALRGYVTTKPKPLSEVILVSDQGDPVLARWRVGLGQAAVWTSDVKNRWALEWVRWPGYAKLFSQLVRSTMRHRSLVGGEAGYTLTTEVDPPNVRAFVDAVGADDRFVNGLETTLEITDVGAPSDGSGKKPKPRTIKLGQTAAGRYEGEFTLDRHGSFLLRAEHRKGDRLVAESATTISLPYPREYLALPPDEALLRRAAATTGGLVSPSAAAALDPGRENVVWHRDLWPPVLFAAIALLLLDVLLRRVRLFGYRKMSL